MKCIQSTINHAAKGSSGLAECGGLGLFVCICHGTPAQHMCMHAVTSSLCDHIDRHGRPRGLHAVSATLYLALHPHNLPLLCTSLKASNTWACAPKCCCHIIEKHSVFYMIWPLNVVRYVYKDVYAWYKGIAFPRAVPALKRPLYLPLPSLSPPPSFPQSIPSNGFSRCSWARHSCQWPS